MNVVVIGSGGREVAIIKSILKSELKPHIICLGGHNNPYIVSNKNITFEKIDICNNDTGLTSLNNKFDDLSANNASWVSTISTINTQLNNHPNFYDTLDAKINTKVGLTGDETISGQKTFSLFSSKDENA